MSLSGCAHWLDKIVAHWRALAERSQHPETRLRFHQVAARYENLARLALPKNEASYKDKASYYVFSWAAKPRVVLINMGKTLDQHIYLDAYDALARFIASRGPHSLILDLSAVDRFDISSSFAVAIATRKPAIPTPMSRFVVAPQPAIYGVCRSVEILRSATSAPITVVRQLGNAFAHFGVAISDFIALEAT